ncbi:hypothetical protein KEM52_002742 [Ascosphaera acerosa]|nr:hypothetical protein KEM52_002742 [Ascosphaera acerosa]
MAVTLTPCQYPNMEYRRLGNTGLFISAISLGGWTTIGGYVDEESNFAILKQAYDLGINFFDTAEAYSAGQSEIVIGKAIKKYGWKRNDLVISTKVNFGAAYGGNDVNNVGLSRKHIVEGTRACLQRLDLEYVDLILAHRPDRYTPMEEIVRAFTHVIERGWAFYWGTSMWSAEEITEACQIAQRLGLIAPVVEQPVYNLVEREKVEGEFARVCPGYGIGLTVWSPLKQGILTGKYNDSLDKIPEGTRLSSSKDQYTQGVAATYGSEQWRSMIEKVKKLEAVAKKLDCKLSNLALAWVLKNGNVTTCLTGASSTQQVIENVESLKLVPKLTPEILAEIDELLENKPVREPKRFGMGMVKN